MAIFWTNRSNEDTRTLLEGAAQKEKDNYLASLVGAKKLVRMRQTHSKDVVVVDEIVDSPLPVADALITTQKDLALLVQIADCVPILIEGKRTNGSLQSSDETSKTVAIGAIHAGRKGLDLEIIESCVNKMSDLGSEVFLAYIGPCAHVCCYEVPKEMADNWRFDTGVTSKGTPAINLVESAKTQLQKLGITDIDIADVCTICECEQYFSYRGSQQKGVTDGRNGGLIAI